MKNRPNRIETERLILRPLEERDRERFIRMAKDARVNATYMLPELSGRAEEDAFFESMREYCAMEERFILGIALKSGELIGFINDCGISGAEAELGYFVGAEHWGRGYATEALRAAMDALFEMGCTALRAGYFEGNEASRRVMEKCGMRPIRHTETVEYKGKTRFCPYMGKERE